MKRKTIYPLIFLTCLTLVMIYIITPSSSIFGSNTDWLSQHVNLADYLRKSIWESKNLFPDYAFHLGAGGNIYNLSYYGLFRLDVLISLFLPAVAMKDIICTYMIINIVLGVNLTYLWLKDKGLDFYLCLVGSILLLSSSVLFHSHRQIMFVDYMPALILGLMGVDRYLTKRKSMLLLVSVVLIITNSYIFSITGLLVIFIYYCFEAKQLRIKEICLFIKILLIGILICGVLLIPSAYVMLENHQSGGAAINILTLLKPRFSISGLLYDEYGCGFSYLVWIGIILGLRLKRLRSLSIISILLIFIPLIAFVLNGFLYTRTKILIPFIPLLIYLTVKTLQEYRQNGLQLDILSFILILIPIIFYIKEPLVLIDVAICIIGIGLYLKINQSLATSLIIMPLLLAYTNNQKEDFVANEKYQKSTSIPVIETTDSRYDSFVEPLNTVNNVFSMNYRTTMYSSISNSLYNNFYYDVIRNPIRIKNRVAMLSSSNIFFQGMMGVEYLYSENVVPIGYQEIKPNVYQNKDVMPLIYATDKSYSLEAFNQLSFPQTLDTLYNNVIVGDGKKDYVSAVKEVNLNSQVNDKSDYLNIMTINNGYRVNTKKKAKLQLDITPQDNQVIIIEFDLEKVKYQETRDTTITINGIKNKLSSTKAAYPNKNDHFTYVLSQNETLDKLDISLSSGRYDLMNLKISGVDYDVIKNHHQEVDSFVGTYNQGSSLAKGEINVSNDGYLVTSLPYQHGYRVLIDGQEVAYTCVNKAFVGTKVSKGKHQVEIKFNAPMKNIGLGVSGVGLLWLVIQERRERNEARVKRIS